MADLLDRRDQALDHESLSEEAPEPAEEVSVLVDGFRYSGWEKVSVLRPLDAVSGSFSVSVSGARPWPLKLYSPLQVLIGDEVLLDGYVFGFKGDGSSGVTNVTAGGRDRTADLVDCSEISVPGEWNAVSVGEIAAAIAEPFGIEVDDQLVTPIPLFGSFVREPGETAWNAVERACRARGVLAYTAGDGRIVITEPAHRRAQVDLKETSKGNVLSSTVSLNVAERFSPIIVRGQRPGSDEESGLLVAQAEGRATDAEVKRFRPLLILAETAVSDGAAATRARWEATVRAARSSRAVVVVQGWRQFPITGRPWAVNEVVFADLPRWNIHSDMLINRVTFTRDGSEGTRTRIELVRADAYALALEEKDEVPTGRFFDPFEGLLDNPDWTPTEDDGEGFQPPLGVQRGLPQIDPETIPDEDFLDRARDLGIFE